MVSIRAVPFEGGFDKTFRVSWRDKGTRTRSEDGSSLFINARSKGWRIMRTPFRRIKPHERDYLLKFLEVTRSSRRFYFVVDFEKADPLGRDGGG